MLINESHSVSERPPEAYALFFFFFYPQFQAVRFSVLQLVCVLQITGVRVSTKRKPPPVPNRTVPHLHTIPTRDLHRWVTCTTSREMASASQSWNRIKGNFSLHFPQMSAYVEGRTTRLSSTETSRSRSSQEDFLCSDPPAVAAEPQYHPGPPVGSTTHSGRKPGGSTSSDVQYRCDPVEVAPV